ncbi:MAG: glucosaminidase domain-containing protein [Solobacterium sp.]|nr:glucosaminidase domain-containing protein [Solobacterium sp.]
MKTIRKLSAFLLSAVILIPPAVHAEQTAVRFQDDFYHVVDFATGEEIDVFYNYSYALCNMRYRQDSYDNLGIVYKDSVLSAEHAIVYLGSDDCTVDIRYTSDVDGESGTLNGCYGKDAAYLGTNDNATEVTFMISGLKARAGIGYVQIVPVEEINVRLSEYTVSEGSLYHEIKGQMRDDNYVNIINNGKAPDTLQEGGNYYSYDGHYFYQEEDLTLMLDDYRNNTREHSVNPESPYYDYYQFVSHRSVSSAGREEMQYLLYDYMGIKGPIDAYQDDDKDSFDDTMTRSQYWGLEDSFLQYSYQYGANALMMLAVSMEESGTGRSSLSFNRNNLFAHAAYDNDAEADATRYFTTSNSLYAHAKYFISGSYCSPLKAQFHGGFFGNKSAGMNVSYSADPYWGEKAAEEYRILDEAAGTHDYRNETLGIKTSEETIMVYQYPETDAKVLYLSGENPDQAFVIVGEVYSDETDWYKIQAEATMNADSEVALSYDYDFENNIGYVKASDLQLVLLGTKEDTAPVHVTFDAAGGTFPDGQESVSYVMPAGREAVCTAPVKDGMLFDHWEGETEAVEQNTVYRAVYRDTAGIEMVSLPRTDYEVNDRISVKGGIVQVAFADGTSRQVSLTTSMISGYSMDKAGTYHVRVRYAGQECSYDIVVNAEADAVRTQLKNRIVDMIKTYEHRDSLGEIDIDYLLSLKGDLDENAIPYLTQTQLRSFDRIMRMVVGERINYILEPNDYVTGVSGLSVSVPLFDSLEKQNLFKDTYRVRVREGVSAEAYALMEKSAGFLNTDVQEAFTISLRKNYSEFSLDGPVLYTIRKPEGAEEGMVYTVFCYDPDDGDVEKCYTRQTENAVTFMGNRDGQYLVAGRRTSNSYLGDDPVESLTRANSSFDLEHIYMYISLSAAVIFVIGMILSQRQRRRLEQEVLLRREEINLEKAREPLPPVDVTQALTIFETEVLRLDEIRQAAQEQDDDQHDD